MSKIFKSQVIVFVNYSTPAIPACFQQSLNRHMLDNVWAQRHEAEEDIRVICDSIKAPQYITEIRYQFGEDFNEYLADEVGELISEQFDVWCAKNNIDELISA